MTYTLSNPPEHQTIRDQRVRLLNQWYVGQEDKIYSNYLNDLNRDTPRKMKAEAALDAEYCRRIAKIEATYMEAVAAWRKKEGLC